MVLYRDMTMSKAAFSDWLRIAGCGQLIALRFMRFCLAFAGLVAVAAFGGTTSSYFVYIGTYTTASSKGIYMFKFDAGTGESGTPVLVAEAKNPSFLEISHDGRFLYAVNETDRFDGQPGGSVSAYAVDEATGTLKLLNSVGTRGSGPCHLAIDPSNRCLVVANYGGGSVAAYRVGSDGRLSEPTSFFQHRGRSVNPRRQEGPHAHGVTFDREGRFVFVPDLGLDQILIYRVMAADGVLVQNEPAFVSVTPGSGPRHFVFHPNGRFAYVINELANTVCAFEYDSAKGSLREIQRVSTLPDGYVGENTTAEIEIEPRGRYLVASNRGHDSLATYAIADDGTLRLVGHASTRGKTPRNFAFDPSGDWLWVGNQASNQLVLFRFRPDTGGLEATGKVIELGAPVCVKYRRVGN